MQRHTLKLPSLGGEVMREGEREREREGERDFILRVLW